MSDVQISMKLTSGDSGLRLAASASDSAEADTTESFQLSFNAALEKESAKSSLHGQRQIPAAASNLSEISLSLVKADAKTDSQTALDATGADSSESLDSSDELSLSLLQQIAFTKNSKQTPSAADTKPIMHNGPVVETDQETEIAELETNLVPSLINKAVKLEQEPVDSSEQDTVDNGTINKDKFAGKLVADDAEKLTKAVSTETINVVVDETSKISHKDNNQQLIEKDANTRIAAKDTKPIYSNEPVNVAITDEAEPSAELVLPNQADKLDKNVVPATKLNEKAETKLDVKPNAKTAPKLEPKLNTQTEIKSDLSQQPTLVQDETELSRQPLFEPASPITGQASDKVPANATKVATLAATNAGSATKAEQMTSQSAAQAQKNNLSSNTSASEQVVAPTKVADAEAAAQLADKLSQIPHNSQRSEHGVSAALANAQAVTAESRLAPATSVTTPNATHAEQVRQSINLMQQDAAGQMRQQIGLMLSQQIQRAEIRLDPAGLGMMQIKIDVQQDQATVQFTVQQQQAKELIEQQLPRLRDMLQQQGIQLTEGQVQQQSQQQQQQLAQQQAQAKQQQAGTASTDDELPAIPIQVSVQQSERLVDYYA